MTPTLLLLAMLAAANPLRVASARPRHDRVPAAAAAGTLLILGVLVSGLVSGPLHDAVDVTGPSARIAAGIALLAVALHDLFGAPPDAEPALTGWRAGIVPLGFPVLFTPAVALVAVAGAAQHGVWVPVAAVLPAMIVAGALLVSARARIPRGVLATSGALGAAIAALVVLDGIYAI